MLVEEFTSSSFALIQRHLNPVSSIFFGWKYRQDTTLTSMPDSRKKKKESRLRTVDYAGFLPQANIWDKVWKPFGGGRWESREVPSMYNIFQGGGVGARRSFFSALGYTRPESRLEEVCGRLFGLLGTAQVRGHSCSATG